MGDALYLRGGGFVFLNGALTVEPFIFSARARSLSAKGTPPCDVSDATTRARLFIERGDPSWHRALFQGAWERRSAGASG